MSLVRVKPSSAAVTRVYPALAASITSSMGWVEVDAATAAYLSTVREDHHSPSSPLLFDTTEPAASGVFSYASRIDSIPNLQAEATWSPGFYRRPVLVAMHGYGDSITSVPAATKARWAGAGAFVLTPGMRGRNGAAGARDASGRELYDVIDGLEAVFAHETWGPLVDPTRIILVGYSGGGGNVLGLAAKAPDLAHTVVSHFGPSDYGADPVSSWAQTNPGFLASLTADVGSAPSQTGPWLSRDYASAIAVQRALLSRGQRPDAKIVLFHDSADSSVSVEQSDRVERLLALSGLSEQLEYHRSTPASSARWLHGYAEDTPVLRTVGEPLWLPRALQADPWVVPPRGRALAAGWLRTRRFELWLGPPSVHPKAGEGGRSHVAEVDYDVELGRFRVRSRTGDARVHVAVGTASAIADLPAGTEVEVVL